MVNLAKTHDTLNVVNDQLGNPTNAVDLAYHILKLAVSHDYGIYHCTGSGICSWYDFAVKIMELGDAPCHVLPIESKDYPAKAARPHFSVLNKTKIKTIYTISIPHWEASLRECMKRITK